MKKRFEDHLFDFLVKMLFTKIEPMQAHVEPLVKQLTLWAYLLGVMIGALIMLVITIILIYTI